MNLLDKIKTQFFRTSVFKGLLNNYISANKVQIYAPDDLQKIVSEKVTEQMNLEKAFAQKEAMRFRIPWQMKSPVDPDRKPMSDLPFSYLRRMAQVYPIARACINRRIRQITQLDWDITTIEEIEGEESYKEQIAIVKNFFKLPMGHKTRMREMLSLMVDDVLTIDAVCFEYQRTRGGELLSLVPVDPTTVALKVTETGATPEPPDTAYVQIIQGQVIAEFTTDEMLYDSLNTRSYTPYGLAPLETLIIQVESALRGALYNLNYFKEGNVPEGFVTLPEDVAGSKDLIEQWQMWFDSLVAGDPRFMRRLKFLPEGSVYTPAKKPEDMAFEKFELWMAMLTCAVFDVPPQDIGLTYQVNKATAESQADLSRERGLFPLANFLKEIFDDIIQVELNLASLQFVFQNLNPVDRKEEVEVAEKEINMGALGVDEYRKEHGREPLGLKPYVKTGQGVVLVDDIVSGKMQEDQQKQKEQQNNLNDKDKDKKKEKETESEEDNKNKMSLEDIRKWRKAIYKDLELKRPLRMKFNSYYIPADVHLEISTGLKRVFDKAQAKILFDKYIDPETRSALKLLKVAADMRRIEDATFVGSKN